MIADKATCTLEKKAQRKERKKNNGEEEEESIRHEYANIESIRECFAVLKKNQSNAMIRRTELRTTYLLPSWLC